MSNKDNKYKSWKRKVHSNHIGFDIADDEFDYFDENINKKERIKKHKHKNN